MREAYAEYIVTKKHNITVEWCQRYKTIVTYRNPMDSLASSFKRYNLEVTEQNINHQIIELKNNGLDDLFEIYDNEQILKLKYESFYNDFDFIFNRFESYFKEPITAAFREKMKDKYDINKVIAETRKFRDFSQYDKTTQIHGNHISESKGMMNSYFGLYI